MKCCSRQPSARHAARERHFPGSRLPGPNPDLESQLSCQQRFATNRAKRRGTTAVRIARHRRSGEPTGSSAYRQEKNPASNSPASRLPVQVVAGCRRLFPSRRQYGQCAGAKPHPGKGGTSLDFPLVTVSSKHMIASRTRLKAGDEAFPLGADAVTQALEASLAAQPFDQRVVVG